MIEAVNSVLQNAQMVRASAVQMSTADSMAANPDQVQKVAAMPQAPYVSPYIHVDVNYNKAVLQLRNGETGDVEDQFPSQTALEAQARKMARQNVASAGEQRQTPIAEGRSAKPSSSQTFKVQNEGAEAAAAAAPAPGKSTAQQQAAFAAATQAGNANAGNVSVFA